MLVGESRKSFQAFLLHRIGHPVIGNIDRHLEKRCRQQADLLHALGQLPLPLRVKVRFSYDLLHGHLVDLPAAGCVSSGCSKNECAPCAGKMPAARMQTHLFGNSAILLFRTRGFASPGYSGFARSENVLKLRSNRRTPRTALLDYIYYRTSNKKGALSSSEDESAPCVGNIPGAKNAYLFSSATRPSFCSGSVALRHQITLVLPVRRTLFFISGIECFVLYQIS